MASHRPLLLPLLVVTIGCIAVVEGGYLLLEHLLAVPAAPAGRILPREGSGGSAPEVGAATLPDPKVIVTRNLFGSVVPGTQKEPLGPGLEHISAAEPQLVLVGTTLDSRGDNRAVILDRKTQEQQLYRQGDAVGGGVLQEIHRGKALLVRDGRAEVLDMQEAAKLRAVARAAGDTGAVPAAPVLPGENREETASGEAIPATGPPVPTEPGREASLRRVVLPQIIRPAPAKTVN
jgi:hypothetical protein